MTDFRYNISEHNGLIGLHVTLVCHCGTLVQTRIALDDIEASIAQYRSQLQQEKSKLEQLVKEAQG